MPESSEMRYDSLLFVSFGGPEGPDEVIPFLENVLRGRQVPRARLLEVAGHYQHFGGVSPINSQVRDLIAAVRDELDRHHLHLPIYWGNRNWRPFLPDALAEMTRAGRRRALAFVTSGQSSYSGCRQYRENIEAARQAAGDAAPVIDKLRVFYNHPDYIAAQSERIRAALARLPEDRRGEAQLVATAHSIPAAMSDGSDYVKQLTETLRLLGDELLIADERRHLVYQSRSGRPQDPWLGPDIIDFLHRHRARSSEPVIVAPIGFISDHMEVKFDLDQEAAQAAAEIGLVMVRAGTVGTHPRFVSMIRKLIQERLDPSSPREAIGLYGPNWDVCPVHCCLPPRRPLAEDQAQTPADQSRT